MEGLIILPILVALYWFYKINGSKTESKSGITKIDDKHYIINNEYVSFDDNDELSIMRQEMEDDRKFNNYRSWKQIEDFKNINDQYFNVKTFVKYDEYMDKVSSKDIEETKDRYDYYLKKCKVLKYDTPLSEKEFAMTETSGILLFLNLSFQMYFDKEPYTLYSPDNAKYTNGYTVEKEFKERYY